MKFMQSIWLKCNYEDIRVEHKVLEMIIKD